MLYQGTVTHSGVWVSKIGCNFLMPPLLNMFGCGQSGSCSSLQSNLSGNVDAYPSCKDRYVET